MPANPLSSKSSLKLNSGYDMPVFGLGTWMSKPGEVGRAIVDAYDAGYRHFDCAMIYQNEVEIGKSFSKLFSNDKVIRRQIRIQSENYSKFCMIDKLYL